MYPARFDGKSGKEAKEIASKHFENLFSQAFSHEGTPQGRWNTSYLLRPHRPRELDYPDRSRMEKGKAQVTRPFPWERSHPRESPPEERWYDTSVVVVWRKRNEEKEVWVGDIEETLTEVGMKSAKEFISTVTTG